MDRIKERFRMGIEDVEMFAAIDQAQLDALTNALVAAKRIFVAGWGRAGNCVKILSMDCSQIGLTTYIVGDNSTPAIQPGRYTRNRFRIRRDKDDGHSGKPMQEARCYAGPHFRQCRLHDW